MSLQNYVIRMTELDIERRIDLILCNRNSSELTDIQDKIFTRDLFNQD